MKKSLLIWGALVVIALCFVGCCYYNTTHCAPCPHCHNQACEKQTCPDTGGDDGTVETMTVEAVEVIPMGPPDKKSAPAKNIPAAKTTNAPATK